MGRSIKVKAEKNGVEMWTYKTMREDNCLQGQVRDDLELHLQDAPLHRPELRLLCRKEQVQHLQAFINRNTFLHQFKVEDGDEVINTTGVVYQ